MPVDLDDTSQPVVFLPFRPNDATASQKASHAELKQNIVVNQVIDLEDGPLRRWEAYVSAWTKCLKRIRSLIDEIHNPIVESLTEKMSSAQSDALPGLPQPELPVFAVTNPYSGPSFLAQVTQRLEDAKSTNYVVELHPSDFPNIATAMFNLISAFLRKYDPSKPTKIRLDLASNDISLLEAWYSGTQESNGSSESPHLVVILYDFEQFDVAVVQDVIYICSLHFPQLPLLFLLSLSTPLASTFIRTTYPRSTLTRIRVHNFTVPLGLSVLERIILDTFFSLDFQPNIMVGPEMLEYLTEHFNWNHPSLDSILNIFQLSHLKHFSADPLTILVEETPGEEELSQPRAFPFLEHLVNRLQAYETTNRNKGRNVRNDEDLASLIHDVDSSRARFHERLNRIRLGISLLQRIYPWVSLKAHGATKLDEPGNVLHLVVHVLGGKVSKELDLVEDALKTLRFHHFGELLEDLRVYFQNLPPDIYASEKARGVQLEAFSKGTDPDVTAELLKTGWLIDYLRNLLVPLEEAPLCEVWYTGMTPFPEELINPSARGTIVAGLLRPHHFMHEPSEDETREEKDLWEFPDTSILFHRYLDSGKMINVYDWFESFQPCLERQRDIGSKGKSPRKGKANGKKKKRSAEEEEKWKLLVQARFIRALHELDYLGFLKHTGRKADHVLRTCFDLSDSQ